MDPDPFDTDDRLDRNSEFVSGASLILACVDAMLLWPLEPEEKKDFRRKLLVGLSAQVDDALRSDAFLGWLQTFVGGDRDHDRDYGRDRSTGSRGQVDRSSADDLRTGESAREELQTLIDRLGKRSESDGYGRPVDIAAELRRYLNGAPPSRESSAPTAASEPPKARSMSEGEIVFELRQTNAQLRELLELQRRSLERGSASDTNHPEERRNGARRNGKPLH